MSATSSVPADQPNQRRAARKVEPGLLLAAQHVEPHPGALHDLFEHLLAVRRLAHGARDEAAEVLDALVLGGLDALAHEVGEAVAAPLGDPARRR